MSIRPVIGVTEVDCLNPVASGTQAAQGSARGRAVDQGDGDAEGTAVDLELDGTGGGRVAADGRGDGGGEGEGLAVGRSRAGAGYQGDRGGRCIGDGQGAADGCEVVVDGAEGADVDSDGILAV